LVRKLEKLEQLRVCYVAGPTGYVLYWQLSALGVNCEVIVQQIFRTFILESVALNPVLKLLPPALPG
jgi:hypothetical protein